MVLGELRKQRTVLEYQGAEFTEVQRREGGIEWPNEVFVKPLRFFDLKAYSLNGFEFFLGEIDDESNA